MGATTSLETLEHVAPVFKGPLSSALWVPRLKVEHAEGIKQAILEGYRTTPYVELGRLLAEANVADYEEDDSDEDDDSDDNEDEDLSS